MLRIALPGRPASVPLARNSAPSARTAMVAAVASQPGGEIGDADRGATPRGLSTFVVAS